MEYGLLRVELASHPGNSSCNSGANGEGRTPMPLRALEPKSSASASSATLARGGYFALYRLFRVGSHAARSLSRQGRHKARSFAAATTCRRFQPIAGPLHIGP